MQLGDFFKGAPRALPINPKPVDFTLVAKGATLPGGEPNKDRRPVRARATAALVFLDGEETQAARVAARRDARARVASSLGEEDIPEPVDEGDVGLDLVYQMLSRALREWDPKEKRAGDKFFPSATVARELLVPREANRLLSVYNEYVRSEHPEDPPSGKNFRGAQG